MTKPSAQTVWIVVTGFGFLIVGYLLALLVVHGFWVHGQPPQIAASFNGFALLFVMALAIERLVQPFAPGLGPDSSIPKVALKEAQSTGNATVAATAAADVTDARNKTAIVTWGLASALAFLLAAGSNITLLHAITDPKGPQVGYWLDLLVTGLVVGAGTKPLNDLWTRLQNKAP